MLPVQKKTLVPILSAFVLVILLLARTGEIFADLYKYTDSSGVVVITDDREKVPKKYRRSMTVTRDERPLATQKLPPSAQMQEEASPQEAAPPAAPKAEPARKAGVTPFVVVAVALVAVFAVFKLSSRLASPQLAKVIYLAFFLGVSAFLYKSYAEHLVEGTISAKRKLLIMFKKANVRELPADDKSADPAPAAAVGR